MYSSITANKRKTWLIMFAFILIIGALGWVIGVLYNDAYAVYWVLGVAAFYAFIQYFLASKLALAVNGAHQITKKEEPRLYRAVENLSITTGLPMPKVYVMDDPGLNAFATGRNPKTSAVCATTGLIAAMTDTELEAVMAHEIGHIKNYDIRVSIIVFGLVSAIGLIADLLAHMLWFGDRDERNNSPIFMVIGLVAVVLAPIVALLVQLAVSRNREYLADSTGALTTRYPAGLASALEKIRDHGSTVKHQNTSTAHLFFANPLKAGSIAKFFSTHPPIEDRIKRLQAMGDKL